MEKKSQKKDSESQSVQSAEVKDASSLTDSDDSDALSDLAVDSDISSDIPSEVTAQVRLLNQLNLSWDEADRAAARHATKVLAFLTVKRIDEVPSLITQGGGIPALVKHLQAPPSTEADGAVKPFEHDVERGSALALAYLALKKECKDQIVGCGALPLLLDTLKRRFASHMSSLHKLFRCSSLAIMNLAEGDNDLKNLIRDLGGIPTLVDLLDSANPLVRLAGIDALLTLAENNPTNKLAIVEDNALPCLIYHLQSDELDSSLQYLSISLLHSLLTNSDDTILDYIVVAGALQPLISLLRSSRRNILEAIQIVFKLADDPGCRTYLVQRGALSPLISLLHSDDNKLKETSANALARLAQDTHNQAGIAYSGGILPLIELLRSSEEHVQEAAAYALSFIAANKDNVSSFICSGGVQVLQHGDFIFHETRNLVQNILQSLEHIIQSLEHIIQSDNNVLMRLIYMMRCLDNEQVQVRVSVALAHLCSEIDQQNIFLYNYGLKILLGLLSSEVFTEKRVAAFALSKLAFKARKSHLRTDRKIHLRTAYSSKTYKWHSSPYDIKFRVEDKLFYLHRDCLSSSSDVFQAMLGGDYQESHLGYVEIVNLRWEIFEMMMRFIYTGKVDVSSETAVDLLRAADRYFLDGLKKLCQDVLVQDLSVTNVMEMYQISGEFYDDNYLRNSCILFLLDHFDEMESSIWREIGDMVPKIRLCFDDVITHRHRWY